MVDAVEELLMSKAEARKELQRRLATLKRMMKDEIEDFAVEHKLEFSFLGMRYFLKDPNGSNRWAKKGIFVSEAEWQSSGWGCDGGDSYVEFSEWEEKNFPYDEVAPDEDEEDPVEADDE